MATEVVLPMLGITAERGKIVEWLKMEGDPVEKGEIIFIVEVEKATTEVESPATGILARILIPVDMEVPVKTTVAIITAPGEALPDLSDKIMAEEIAAPPSISAEETIDTAISPVHEDAIRAEGPQHRIRAMPLVRRKAKEYGLDLSRLPGSGPSGAILLKDVEAGKTGIQKAEAHQIPLARTAPMPQGFGDMMPMTTVRKVIARKMSQSAFTAPHIYFFTDVFLDPLLDLRKKILPEFEAKFSIRPSINDFLIKAVALNILDFPMLNAQLRGEEIYIVPEIHMGLAVATQEGLLVPAIAHADQIGIGEIAVQRSDLVKRAREGTLTLEEMERGTFTISSLAQYDITHFTAILNPPQSGILTVGKTDVKLDLEEERVVKKTATCLGLSVDHRIIDGAMAADFLQNLKWKLERPSITFLSI